MSFISFVKRIYLAKSFLASFPLRSEFGKISKNSVLEYPIFCQYPQSVYVDEHVKIRANSKIINSPNERIIIKKYTVASLGLTIVSQNHRSTVTIPQIILGKSHVNDKFNDIIINEDVWIGVNVTILSGASNIGRGAILAANSVVTKPVPPYAVMAGCPAKIIAVKFSKDQILEHERSLYEPADRMSIEEIDKLFTNYYKEKKVFGTGEISSADKEKIINMKILEGIKDNSQLL